MQSMLFIHRRKSWKNWFSDRTSYLFVFISFMVFLFLFVLCALDWRNSVQDTRSFIADRSMRLIDDLYNEIENSIRERVADLQLFADRCSASSGEWKKPHFLQSINPDKKKHSTFSVIRAIDKDRKTIESIPNSDSTELTTFNPSEDSSHESLLQQVELNGSHQIALMNAGFMDSIVLEICTPVFIDANGKTEIDGFLSDTMTGDFLLNDRFKNVVDREAFYVSAYCEEQKIYDSDASEEYSQIETAKKRIEMIRPIFGLMWKINVSLRSGSYLARQIRNVNKEFLARTIGAFIFSTMLAFVLIALHRLLAAHKEKKIGEEHFQSLVDSASNFVLFRLAVDPELPLQAKVLFVSSSIKNIMGVADPTNVSDWFSQIHEDDVSKVLKDHLHCMTTGSPFECQMRIFHPGKNEWRWIESKSTPILDRHRNPIFYNGVFFDITPLKQIEERLATSERMYRDAIEVISAVPYYQNYTTNQYDFVGAGIEQLTGYASSEFTPVLWKSLVKQINLLNNLKDMNLEDALQRSRGDEGANWRADYRIETRSGEEKWLANAAVQVRDERGEIVGSLGILQDITERKKTEKALNESVEKYRELVQSANSIILRMDANGYIKFFNEFAQRYFGYEEREIIGLNAVGTIFPSTSASSEFFSQLTIDIQRNPNQCITNEIESVRSNGDRVWIVWTYKPITRNNGRIKEILCIGNDITELRNLQEQFRQSQKMEAIGQLASGVAHDFNNLLMAILGFSDLALKSRQLDESLRKDLIEIRLAGERAADLTRQLLAFSRKQVLKPSTINLNQLVINMDKMLRRLIGEDVELIVIPDDTLGHIKADRGQIEQILLNLAVNARDAMPKGGKLIVETANIELDEKYVQKHVHVLPGAYVMMAVSDSGMGIPKSVLERIFDPFFTTKDYGTGLGLSTVYGIVIQSGGHITAESEPDDGTIFRIYFPRVDELASTAPQKVDFVRPTEGAITILLVEDEEMVRRLVYRVLNKHGYTVLEAGYGSEAIELSEKHAGPIDLLITDVVMPKMSGRKLAERIVSMRPDIKVLYMSGYTDDAIVHHGILEKGIAFLHKPFTPDSLAHKVHDVLFSNAEKRGR